MKTILIYAVILLVPTVLYFPYWSSSLNKQVWKLAASAYESELNDGLENIDCAYRVKCWPYVDYTHDGSWNVTCADKEIYER